ncbi:MAG: NAD(P)H-hydrate dehydratase [Spirochaetes bacterium]|nr:NAD(P)H-hydrate dehydratase [Spirochaetota bacterium]
MKVVTAEQMRHIDAETIHRFGIPPEVLMAYAGRVAANYILDEYAQIVDIAVVCGSGNNGGDGFVIAYLLSNSGKNVKVFFVGEEEKLSESARIYCRLCKNAGISVVPFSEENVDEIIKSPLVVDAIVGTGFCGSARGNVARAIAAINKSDGIVISIDVPSGLPADGEAPNGEAVYADVTITIGLPKISLVTYPGKQYAGKLVLADIGFPRSLCESSELKSELIDEQYIATQFPYSRDPDAHKRSWAHVLFVGGFDGMEGALLLATTAFFETGGSIATALTTASARNVIAGKIPELMTAAIAPNKALNEIIEKRDHINFNDNILNDVKSALNDFFSQQKQFGIVVIGPGMGRGVFSKVVFEVLVEEVWRFGITGMIIDGDGLFHLANFINEKKSVNGNVLITPHFLEASRIYGKTVEEIKRNRFQAALELSRHCNSVVLLKGPATIVTNGIESLINTTGNQALATAGSGDVLCGIIAALASRGITLMEAAALGAWIHGRAADLYVRATGKNAMRATDIVKYIGEVLRSIHERRFC